MHFRARFRAIKATRRAANICETTGRSEIEITYFSLARVLLSERLSRVTRTAAELDRTARDSAAHGLSRNGRPREREAKKLARPLLVLFGLLLEAESQLGAIPGGNRGTSESIEQFDGGSEIACRSQGSAESEHDPR